MRLNFSGVNEDEIREGIRRIGEVVREQVAMYGTLTGARPRIDPRRVSEEARLAAALQAPAEKLAKILQLPAKRQRAG
jgi:2-aminoadipate transaminase